MTDQNRAREEIVRAILTARNLVPGTDWNDGMTEGVARIEVMLAEKAADAILATSPADDRLRIAREALVTGYENAVNAPPGLRVRKLVDTIERALTLLQEPTDAAD